MMTVYDEYQTKLCTPDVAVHLVKDGDWIDYSQTCSFPAELDAALAKRRDELHDIKVRNAISCRPIQIVEQDPEQKTFTYNLQTLFGCRTGISFAHDFSQLQLLL